MLLPHHSHLFFYLGSQEPLETTDSKKKSETMAYIPSILKQALRQSAEFLVTHIGGVSAMVIISCVLSR